MFEIIIALLLAGYISNTEGVIGIRYCAMDRRIDEVYNPSPAYDAGLQKGDLVVSVNGIPVRKTEIDGDAGSICDMVIDRVVNGKHTLIEYYMLRVDPRTVPGFRR